MGMRKYKRQSARKIMANHGMTFKSDGAFEGTFPGKKLTRTRRVRALAKKWPLPLWKKMLNKWRKCDPGTERKMGREKL